MSVNTLAVSKNTEEYGCRKPSTAHIINALKITMKYLKGSMRENTRKNTDTLDQLYQR